MIKQTMLVIMFVAILLIGWILLGTTGRTRPAKVPQAPAPVSSLQRGVQHGGAR